ncbi:MAG: response regulator [Planctomycetota bacterium]|nr:response regulator [Planctomycetota bacterium]
MTNQPASILVTDDESNIRMMLRTALSSEGYAVEEACNGREALDAISRRVPDLMVLDLSMPVMDGMSVLEQLKTLAGGRPRVIVLTAYGSIPAAVKATRLGAIDFLEKPITPKDLRECVAAALEAPPADSIAVIDQYERGYAGVLDRVRKSLRMADYTSAESLLMRAADLSANDPAYFNLLGVLYEARKQWRLARKFYDKALSTGKEDKSALANLRRLSELQRFGKTSEPVALGDDIDIWFAKLPDEPLQPRH